MRKQVIKAASQKTNMTNHKHSNQINVENYIKPYMYQNEI